MGNDNEIILHDDYPFRDDVRRMQQFAGKYIKDTVMPDGGREKITVTVEREYNRTPFIMLYQHKEMLNDLSPEACKILIHMSVHMTYGDQKANIIRSNTQLGKRVFSRAILELISHRILSKVANKREWYWVNITILIMGVTKKLENG